MAETEAPGTTPTHRSPLTCSRLRWDLFQQPQHLFADLGDSVADTSLDIRATPCGVTVVTPMLPHGMDRLLAIRTQRSLLDALMAGQRIAEPLLWYYTPQVLASGHLAAAAVYDGMDELLSIGRSSVAATLQEKIADYQLANRDAW